MKSFSNFVNQIVSLRLSIFSNDDLDLSKLINLRYLHIEKSTHKQSISIRPEILSPCWNGCDEYQSGDSKTLNNFTGQRSESS
ncbi:unnamed protein product [Adineta steineri]|uniref:Uncharacterized protein n=1 Tax=Adineta steineri TaxID=433720 RepID=A0A815IBF1_9BILA|nr:unnamed protein product [Adineta steineri]CAF1435210.1 unnamed protein product [Adineta steineri]CAF1515802.1 unnamed protein product [Adineta steineri]CAF1601118.1 unnamed protein product [Adineta steineri]